MASERLISADKLIRDIVDSESKILANVPYSKEWFARFADRQFEILAIIERQPCEKIVRCKDCKYLHKEKMMCLHIRNRVFNTGKPTFSNHFCSYGSEVKNNDR